jgi:hypothetical protein
MTAEELAAVRRHTSTEVVQVLTVPPQWLEELVPPSLIPV